MNNLKILILGMLVTFFSSCTDGGSVYTTEATIYLINETNVVVKSDDILGYTIQPGDTLVHTESHTNEYGERPSIDNYDVFSAVSGSRGFIYGDNSQCEFGLTEIENYENRKEVSPLSFELTFRFTEEKRSNSVPCNL